jgi:predicted negative regulator of RcsB-dependent stress response
MDRRPPTKRLSRKEIRKPDQFIDLMGRSYALAVQKKQVLLAAGIAVALILGGLGGWNLYQRKQNEAAAVEYFHAAQLYRDQKHKEATPALAQVALYHGSVYGRLALLHQAQSHVALKEYPKAIDALQELLRRETAGSSLRQIALINLGYVQEMSGQCPEAMSAYSEAEKLPGSLRGEALLGTARCSVQAGNPTSALDAYRQYLTDDPASYRSSEVSVRISELEAGTLRPVKK